MAKTIRTDPSPQFRERAPSQGNNAVVQIILVVRDRKLAYPVHDVPGRQGVQEAQGRVGSSIDRKSDMPRRLAAHSPTSIRTFRARDLDYKLAASGDELDALPKFSRAASRNPEHREGWH
jgi:hypothetical protein